MPVRLSTRLTVSIALWIFCLASLWLTAVPDTMRPSTYAGIAALLTALAAMTMTLGMSGQTAGLGTLLEATSTAPATPPDRPSARRRDSRRIDR